MASLRLVALSLTGLFLHLATSAPTGDVTVAPPLDNLKRAPAPPISCRNQNGQESAEYARDCTDGTLARCTCLRPALGTQQGPPTCTPTGANPALGALWAGLCQQNCRCVYVPPTAGWKPPPTHRRPSFGHSPGDF